jgi:hypothetical protein
MTDLHSASAEQKFTGRLRLLQEVDADEAVREQTVYLPKLQQEVATYIYKDGSLASVTTEWMDVPIERVVRPAEPGSAA